MNINVLIVHYNNPESLKKTIVNIIANGFHGGAISVFDNASKFSLCHEAETIVKTLKCTWIGSAVNRGWGGGINEYIKSKRWTEDDLLMICAHDALIEAIDIPRTKIAFLDKSVGFISPQYPCPENCTYTLSRSFKSQAGQAESEIVEIGHATLCIARISYLQANLFDENFFIYGCESEIFLRLADQKIKTLLWNEFIVANPTTDTSSAYRTLAFTINSVYIAKKRGGLWGASKRIAVVVMSIIRLFSRGDYAEALIKIHAIRFSLTNLGSGFSGYLKSRS